MADFALDERIAAESIPVCELGLSTLRLMRDGNFPWLVLVPRRNGVSEIVDLEREERLELMDEISRVSLALRTSVRCEKLNVAALGNKVRQLHIHVVARNSSDPAWPNPVWGAVPPKDYPARQAEELAAKIAAQLT